MWTEELRRNTKVDSKDFPSPVCLLFLPPTGRGARAILSRGRLTPKTHSAHKGGTMKPCPYRTSAVVCLFALIVATSASVETARGSQSLEAGDANYVLDWNQIFIDTLVATSTPNSSSQRLGAIVHTAIFDAYNGIERRYEHIFVDPTAPHGTSRSAAVIAAAHKTLVELFPLRASALDESYAASMASLSDDDEPRGALQRGISWGEEVAAAVLAWRATDGFNASYPAFVGGTAIGQWRPIPPATSMSAQGLAFTSMFVLASNTQFQPLPPQTIGSVTYSADFNAVKTLGRDIGSSRTPEQTLLAPFWEGNASVHWNQAANQIARANGLSMSRASRLLAELNLAMADTAFTIWKAKRDFGLLSTGEVTWRPVTAIHNAALDGNPDTIDDASWQPSVVPTPSHPEYPAGHPSLNGAAATVLLSHFSDAQTFTLTTTSGTPPVQTARDYASITQAREDGNNARVWGGMHYPSTVRISDEVGEAIALYVDQYAMQPVRP
jgi:hypothetical protein